MRACIIPSRDDWVASCSCDRPPLPPTRLSSHLNQVAVRKTEYFVVGWDKEEGLRLGRYFWDSSSSLIRKYTTLLIVRLFIVLSITEPLSDTFA